MSAALVARLSDELVTLAWLWKLSRADGVVVGLTSHDRPLTVDGVRYAARPGMTPSAIRLSDEPQGDGFAVEAALGSGLLSAADLSAGRWADARVELFLCDWRDPSAGQLRLAAGRIGDVTRALDGARFEAELVPETAALMAKGPVRLSPLCRARLGDARCGVDMAGRQADGELAAVTPEGVRLVAAPADPDRFACGRMRVLTGPMAGIDRLVVRVVADEVRLEDPAPAGLSAGDRIRLWEGCDRRFSTCASRFGNAVAFDGEPHVPGSDALLRHGEP
jgi:uncharacterized phage protein (TIGR02218 family)